MTKREISFHYYGSEIASAETRGLPSILRKISNIGLSQREIEIEGGNMRLEDFEEERPGVITGSLTHGRFDNIPGRASTFSLNRPSPS